MFLDSVYYLATIDSSIVNQYAKMSRLLKTWRYLFVVVIFTCGNHESRQRGNFMCAGIGFVTVSKHLASSILELREVRNDAVSIEGAS